MKLTKTITFFNIIIILSLRPCYGAADLTGTTRGAFLKLNGGVKAVSMGDTFIAIADDPSAIYWNPAGLSQINSFMLSSTYVNWLAGINCANFSIVRPMGRSTMGISFNYVNIGGIEETTLGQPGGTGRIISPNSYVLTAAYVYKFWPELTLGLNGKLLSETIDESTSTGYGLDLGLLWQMLDNLSLGFNARSFLGSFGGSPLPSNYGVGLSFKLSNLLLAADYNIPNDNISTFHVGAEYNFRNILFGRVGYNTRKEEGAGGTFGVGLGLKWRTINFDYAYVPYGDLGATHRFSFGLLPFGESKTKLTGIIIKPSPVSVRAGEAVKLEAKGYDNRWNKVAIAPTWEVAGRIGTIEAQTGMFYAEYAGSGEVIVKIDNVSNSTKITVKPGKLAKLVISPQEAKIRLNETLKFNCKGFDRFGNYIEVSPLWNSVGGIGSINQKGEFLATNLGKGKVFAKVGDLVTWVPVSVIPSTQ